MQFYFQQTPAKTLRGAGPFLEDPRPTPVEPRRGPGKWLYQADAPEGHVSATDSRASLEKKTRPPIHPVLQEMLTGGINKIVVNQYRCYDKHRVEF